MSNEALETLKGWLDTDRFEEVDKKVIKEAISGLEIESAALTRQLILNYKEPALTGLLSGIGDKKMTPEQIAKKANLIAEAMVHDSIQMEIS